MKPTLKPLKSAVVGTAVIFIMLVPLLQQAGATTQSTSNSSTSHTIEDVFEQVSSTFSGIADFFTNISGTVSAALSDALGDFGVPDLASVLEQLENTPTSSDEGAKLSEALENRQSGNGSFAIRSDLANQATRRTAVAVMNAATLGKDAQQLMVQQAQVAQQAIEENARLAEESQNLDVTQQIMQNLSQQSALEARVNRQLLQEAQQARVDRSISNTLSAQIAEEVSAANIADRRQEIGSANMSIQHTGLISLPGGYYLGAEN
jgi:hypothetical protein